MTALFDCLEKASKITKSVIVFFSGGKDSVITLDLCMKYFDRVEVVYMYLVQGLSFTEYILEFYEQRYGINIRRVPHVMLSEWLRYGTFKTSDFDSPRIKINDIYNHVRKETGIYWIAAGETINDSIVRRAMIKKSSTIDVKRGRIYPIAEWGKKHILGYIKHNKLKITPEYKILKFSFRSLEPSDLNLIKRHYPQDFKTICNQFPFAEASQKQYEFKKD